MSGIEGYLREVRRRLGGMDPSVREDALRELRSHLADASAANGGNVAAAVSGMGDPASVARRYRDLYGYGRVFRGLFAVGAGVLGVLSVPVLFGSEALVFPLYLSSIFLLADIAFVMWVSVAAGNRAGLVAGLAAGAGRFVAFGVAYAVTPGAFVLPGAFSLFASVSALLVVLGWLPGRTKQMWRKPGAEL